MKNSVFNILFAKLKTLGHENNLKSVAIAWKILLIVAFTWLWLCGKAASAKWSAERIYKKKKEKGWGNTAQPQLSFYCLSLAIFQKIVPLKHSKVLKCVFFLCLLPLHAVYKICMYRQDLKRNKNLKLLFLTWSTQQKIVGHIFSHYLTVWFRWRCCWNRAGRSRTHGTLSLAVNSQDVSASVKMSCLCSAS